jgi:hypothetical protein
VGLRDSIRIRSSNSVHRHGESWVGREFNRVPVEGRLWSSWSLLLELSRWSTPSIFMIWWARMWVGSGAMVVMFMTSFARDQSNVSVLRGFWLGGFLALALVGNHDRGSLAVW